MQLSMSTSLTLPPPPQKKNLNSLKTVSKIIIGNTFSCFRYLYWTNCNHLNATIERSRLNGSDHQIVVHENLFQPLGIAVDVERNLIYWSDEREGLYYSIESSNPDGGSRRTLIHGTHHQPFSIAVDDQDIYWSDWINNAVWTMPKDSFQGGVEPFLVAKYDMINTPMGLITPTGNTTMVNSTYCEMHRSKVRITLISRSDPRPPVDSRTRFRCTRIKCVTFY